MNHLRETLRTLVIEALPHHAQTEVLREAQSISEMIDTLEQETTRVQSYVEDFAKHFAAPPSEPPTAVFRPAWDTLTPEQEADVKYSFAHGATIAELAMRFNVEKSTIFKLVHVPGEKIAEPEPVNGDAPTGRRGRPPKVRER